MLAATRAMCNFELWLPPSCAYLGNHRAPWIPGSQSDPHQPYKKKGVAHCGAALCQTLSSGDPGLLTYQPDPLIFTQPLNRCHPQYGSWEARQLLGETESCEAGTPPLTTFHPIAGSTHPGLQEAPGPMFPSHPPQSAPDPGCCPLADYPWYPTPSSTSSPPSRLGYFSVLLLAQEA